MNNNTRHNVTMAIISVMAAGVFSLLAHGSNVYAKTTDNHVAAYTEITKGDTLLVKTQGVTKTQEAAVKKEMSYLPEQLTDRLAKDGVVIHINDPEMKPMFNNQIGYWNPGTKVTTVNGDHCDVAIVGTTIEVDASELLNKQGRRTVLHEIGHQLDCGSWQHAGIENYFNANADGAAYYAKYKDLIGSYDSYAAVSVYNAQEFFAEGFSICEENPDWATKNCPDLYDWYQGIINLYIYG